MVVKEKRRNCEIGYIRMSGRGLNNGDYLEKVYGYGNDTAGNRIVKVWHSQYKCMIWVEYPEYSKLELKKIR